MSAARLSGSDGLGSLDGAEALFASGALADEEEQHLVNGEINDEDVRAAEESDRERCKKPSKVCFPARNAWKMVSLLALCAGKAENMRASDRCHGVQHCTADDPGGGAGDHRKQQQQGRAPPALR